MPRRPLLATNASNSDTRFLSMCFSIANEESIKKFPWFTQSFLPNFPSPTNAGLPTNVAFL